MSWLSTKMPDTGPIIVTPGVRSVAQTLERARVLARKLINGRAGFAVDDFLADRKRDGIL